MCEPVLEHLATGAPLSPEQRAHAEGCPNCRVILAATRARPLVAPAPLPPPTPSRLRARARQRVAVRATAAAAVLAVLIGVIAGSDRPPTAAVEPEPDLLALLDEVDGLGAETLEDPPGTEALALLDPLDELSPDPLSDDLFFY